MSFVDAAAWTVYALTSITDYCVFLITCLKKALILSYMLVYFRYPADCYCFKQCDSDRWLYRHVPRILHGLFSFISVEITLLYDDVIR